MKRLALLLALMAVAAAARGQGTPGKPPAAPVRPYSHDYFGTEVSDPFHYLENLKDPGVQAWIGAQGRYARDVLDRIPGRQALLAQVTRLADSAPARVGQVDVLPGDRVFYLKELARQTSYRLYERDGLTGQDKLLVDPLTFKAPGQDTPVVTYFVPSPDGNYLVYGISSGGTEQTTLHVIDTRTGQTLPDSLSQIRFPVAAWLPDGHSFFYNRLAPPAAGAPASAEYENSRVYLHELGTNPAEDLPAFGEGVVAGLELPADGIPWMDTAPGSSYAVAVVESGTDQTLQIYAARLDEVATPKAHWQRVGDDQTHILDYTLKDNDLFLLVAGRQGPAVARVALRDPSENHWGLMLQLPYDTGVSGLEAASDALYLTDLQGGGMSLVRLPYNSAVDILRVNLPFSGDVRLYPQDPRATGVLVMLSSWTRSPAIYSYHPKPESVSLTSLWPSGPYDDPQDVVAADADALGSDGALVPLTILYKQGLRRDGTHPTLLMGYGSYSIMLSPVFSPLWRVWLDRGGVLAFAHVRGGGEYGGLWRFEGTQVGLANRFFDYLTCAQYLVDQGYTTPRLLAGMSGSAGGILVGRAITERPGLFRAVVIESGLLDLLEYENTPNGVMNVPEFGSTKTLAGFQAIYSVSSYDHVQPGVSYPAVLLEVGMNDPRVAPWQSAKMGARLQADSTSGLPVLLRVDRSEGHALASTAGDRQELFTDEMSFLFWQLGVPGFEPGPGPAAAETRP